MNILILAAGEPAAGEPASRYPLWLAEAGGATILERQVRALACLHPSRLVFAFRHADVRALHLSQIAELLAPGCVVVDIARETQGAACTALLALPAIDRDDELMITSVTDLVDVDLAAVVAKFRSNGADAGLVTFESIHPRYSYVQCDEHGSVIEAAEKRPISRMASTGHYWFRRADEFFEAVKSMIRKDASVQGRFFICPALNEMVLNHKTIAVHHVRADQYHPLKAPQQVGAFEHSLELGQQHEA